jgi:hypothetical protein
LNKFGKQFVQIMENSTKMPHQLGSSQQNPVYARYSNRNNLVQGTSYQRAGRAEKAHKASYRLAI